jgi:hypothetical protein
MPIDRRSGTRTVGITHGHEENGSVEIKKAKAVRGGRGKEMCAYVNYFTFFIPESIYNLARFELT